MPRVLLADGSLAEDVVQDMFIHFWENRIKLQVKDSLRAYFYTCIRHRALKNLQKQAIVRKHNPKLTEFIEYLLHSEYSVEEEQEIERIKAIMQELPPQCLKVFMLSAIEEKKYKSRRDFTTGRFRRFDTYSQRKEGQTDYLIF